MAEKTLSDLVTDFLEYCELDRNLAQSTIQLYAYYLGELGGWLAANHPGLGPDRLDPEIIREYRIYLSRRTKPFKGPLKRSTQNNFLVAIRALLRYLAKKEIPAVSADQIDLGKSQERVIKFLDHDQLNRLLAAPDTSTDLGTRDRAILEILFSTGLRVSELVKLNIDQINLNQKEFSVVGKGGHARVVFLSEAAVEWTSQYVRQRPDDQIRPLFIRLRVKTNYENHGEKMRLTRRSIERVVEKYVKEAGLPVAATVHTLRHTFASDLLRNGADLRSVQELLGHKNVATTQIYTHVTNPQLRSVHERFHGK